MTLFTKMKMLTAAGAVAMVSMTAAPAMAVPFYTSTNQASFDAKRNVTNYDFSVPTNFFGKSYTEGGVTFTNANLAVGHDNNFVGFNGSTYLSANYDQQSGGTPFTIQFAGTVLGLNLGSYFGAQTVNYVVNGRSGSVKVPGNQGSTFLGFDTGGASGISVTFSPTEELDILGFQTAVPEAATWAMMMVGLGVVGGSLRRRRTVSARVALA